MSLDLVSLVGGQHSEAFALRTELLLELAGDAPADLQRRTACLTLLAGAGTRWKKSLASAVEAGDPRAIAFPNDAPRGLFPVRNYLETPQKYIPMAAYALEAFRGLGSQTLVVRGWEEEIRRDILNPLGQESEDIRFCTQKAGPAGEVLGHGDATRQAYETWKDSDFVIVNFGGDANSPLSALCGVLAISMLDRLDEGVDLLLPVASIEHPAYPVELDDKGIPVSFGHDKLGGTAHSGQPATRSGKAFTNVGIRVYRTSALAGAIHEIVDSWWTENYGYSIPGNDPEAREFALDNVDAMLARRGRARILATSLPEELTPAKSYDEVGRFEEAVRTVRADWDLMAKSLESEYPSNPWTKQHLKGACAKDCP